MKKVVLITGASSGMGKATAQLLLQNGYTVYGAARRVEKMDDLKKAGAHILQMDVSDDASMQRGIAEMMRVEKRIDILINNAGFGSFGSMEDVPISEARYQLEVNVFGLARLTQLVLPHMRAQRSGKIVNITSTGGKLSSPLAGWYHASKYAAEALSDSLRMEVKQFGIQVIIIEPGAIQSEWSDISMQGLQAVSKGKAYSPLAEKIVAVSKKVAPKSAEPDVIARLILKSVTARNPKIRYHAGYLSGMILFLKKVLSDKQFDKLMLSQMK
jgi:short-subunit dehydrogenase